MEKKEKWSNSLQNVSPWKILLLSSLQAQLELLTSWPVLVKKTVFTSWTFQTKLLKLSVNTCKKYKHILCLSYVVLWNGKSWNGISILYSQWFIEMDTALWVSRWIWTLHYGLAGGHLFKKNLHLQTIFIFFFLKNIKKISSKWKNSLLFSDLI